MGLGSFIGKMFGTDKAVDTVINQTSNALDKLIYTKEEKAENAAKEVSEARQMVIDWMKNTEGQNLARRLLAIIIAATWLMQYLSMNVLSIVAVWADKPDNFIKSSKVIGDYAESMNGAMMLILGFYFAAPHLGKIAEGALTKFGKTKG